MSVPLSKGALLLATLSLAGPPAVGSPAMGSQTVVLRAGTIHVVEEGLVLRDGALVLVVNGRIQAVGKDLEIPANAEVIDYGPDAVIVPGFVAAHSPYGLGEASARTASPGTRGVDGFDTYGNYAVALSSGVTSAYVMPAEGRLIAGVGALVKLGGAEGDGRIVNASAAIHGAVDESARRAPGFWEPPIPSTVDVGLGYEQRQLPGSTMGAIVALEELLAAASSRDVDSAARVRAEEAFGYYAAEDLAGLLDGRIPWCLAASRTNEIRALLDLARNHDLNLIIDKAEGAASLASEIAAAGASVVFRVPFQPNTGARDPGRGRDDRWPSFDTPAALARAGVRVAITGAAPSDLLFSARLAARGGLSAADALRAITLTPAEIYGAADRLGSLSAGKDADLCVLNGEPFGVSSSVLATWVNGELAWNAPTSDATVIEVEELHVGDGEVLRPGQLLMRAGEIVEVGRRVSHPLGAQVVRGQACMPGMIDALGHLGLEGASKVPSLGFELADLVGPGNSADRRVAKRGITTVVLAPRGSSGAGAPAMAYKPASRDFEGLVVADPVAVRLDWRNSNRLEAGKDVRKLLGKALEYAKSWDDYEAAMAAWTPPPPEPPKASEDKEGDEPAATDAKPEDEEKEKEADEKKPKKSKKKGEEELEPDPITGLWHAEASQASASDEEADEDADKKKGEKKGEKDEDEEPQDRVALKMRLLFEAAVGSGDVLGNLRCDAASDERVEVSGYWDRDAKKLRLRGLGSRGNVTLEATPSEKVLKGTLTVGAEVLAFQAQRMSKEYVVAGRSERREKEKSDEPKDPKGMPKRPKLDEKLEPLRNALVGEVAIVVEVDREDEILECVAAFEAAGIRPILLGAADAHYVASEIAGRVAGVLLDPRVRIRESERGTRYRTPYSDLQNAGIPVAFHSGAEEGAIELPLAASYAVANGMSPEGALRALTVDAAAMMTIGDRVGSLRRGRDADVLLLDGPPLEPETQILRAWVNGSEVY